MAGSRNKGNPGLMGWIDDRFPATAMWEDHLSKYYAPKKLQRLVLLRFPGAAGAG